METAGNDGKACDAVVDSLLLPDARDRDGRGGSGPVPSRDHRRASFRLPLFEWTITHGLQRLPSRECIVNTGEPRQLLQYLERLPEEGIFHLKDFTRHLTDPTLTRALREVATVFGKKCSFLILTEVSVELPHEIEHLVAHYRLYLPDRDELRQVVDNVVRSLSGYHPIRFEITLPQFEELLTALGGLTLNQARQTVAYCAIEDGRLSAEDIRGRLTAKPRSSTTTACWSIFRRRTTGPSWRGSNGSRIGSPAPVPASVLELGS